MWWFDGCLYEGAALANMVFQGTVWGPPLWNIFFEDAHIPVNLAGFLDVFFADDLNCFRAFPAHAEDYQLQSAMEECQKELHKWGNANCVQFEII